MLNGLPNIFLEAARHRTLGVSSPQGGVSEDDNSHKSTPTVGDSLSVMFASCNLLCCSPIKMFHCCVWLCLNSMWLQDAKEQKRIVSKMVCLVNYFGRNSYEICPNPTPTMFDEYCRMIVDDHPEVADRSYDVKIPSTKWVSYNAVNK